MIRSSENSRGTGTPMASYVFMPSMATFGYGIWAPVRLQQTVAAARVVLVNIANHLKRPFEKRQGPLGAETCDTFAWVAWRAAAAEDHRSVTSLVEKVMSYHLPANRLIVIFNAGRRLEPEIGRSLRRVVVIAGATAAVIIALCLPNHFTPPRLQRYLAVLT